MYMLCSQAMSLPIPRSSVAIISLSGSYVAMSTDVTEKLQTWACYSYRSASMVREIMRDLTKDPNYSFNDLIGFRCLSW